MKSADRWTKLLLGLLVIGIWSLVLRPLVTPAQAAGKAASVARPKWEYAIQSHQYDNGRFLTPTVSDMNQAGRDGWEMAFITGGMDVVYKRRIN